MRCLWRLSFLSFVAFASFASAAALALPFRELDVLCSPIANLPPTKLPLKLESGAHVALIGNGLFERMQEHAWFEAMTLQRFAGEEIVFRTLAWPGDEVAVMPRPEDYGDLHQHLNNVKADVILAAFGLNESFKDAQALPDFERNLAALVVSLKLRRYNGKVSPQIVLVSPIAHEDLQNPNLPDGKASNGRLKLYTDAMARVAKRCGVAFVSVFDDLRVAMEARGKKMPLTENGIRLNDAGYRLFSETLFR